MALNPIVDSRDVRFVLFEMLEVDKLTKYRRFADFDKDMFEEVLELAEKIAVNLVYPANAEGDRNPVKYNPDTKEVIIPDGYKPALDAYHEAGFLGLATEQEVGGMGMPHAIAQATTEYFTAASVAFSMYPMLSVGALNLVLGFAPDKLKPIVAEKVLSGEWGGTMCLTEPDAGSDVGALKTKAVKNDDSTYRINGQKIFISSGDNDYYKNIIHPVLARIEGDPPGTKGISIFLTPKYWIGDDGSMGEKNDVICSGIEHKMGINGSATCSLSFGDEGTCKGILMGEERKGMKIMFQMMNEARLYVGLQGEAVSSAAYMHAITYAKNRVQGTDVKEMANPDADSVPIIRHPDVRRMLLSMKSRVEGMRALSYYIGYLIDITHVDKGSEQAVEAQALVDFLIPICKAGNTDMAWKVTADAIQVYGGYGYTRDYPVEQYARDAKILSLYEGTNAIQSMDLTMRKLLMNRVQYNYSIFKKKIMETVEKSRGVVDDVYIGYITKGLEGVDKCVSELKNQMGDGNYPHIFANATPLQQVFAMMTYGWMHLWSLNITLPKMKDIVWGKTQKEREAFINDNPEAAYYSGRVVSSQFYLGAEFQKIFGRIEYILTGEAAVERSFAAQFTGALEE